MNEEIYFSDEDIFYKVSEILKKNGIEESTEDAAFKDGGSFIDIVLRLTKNFIKEKIAEEDLTSSLQKQLGVSVATAKNIIEDIKEKILPLAEKIAVGAKVEEEKPIISIPTRTTEDRKIRSARSITKPPEVIKKAAPGSSKKPDNYREPIE